LWDFGNLGTTDSMTDNSDSVLFDTPDTDKAIFTNTDHNWLTDAISETTTIERSYIHYYVAVGDSITKGNHDNISSDNMSQDGRNNGKGYEPILNDLLTNTKGHPHTIINEGISGASSKDGLIKMPSIINKHIDSHYFLIQYGTNDAYVEIPSGLGLQEGHPDYPGTYKYNLQQIISMLKKIGKVPYLAKTPFALGKKSYLNSMLQEYNLVVDELVSENNIRIVPPDFYTFFKNHPEQIADCLHPNGIGYQSMAKLWHDALINTAP
jgi:lysophospholipase L1-like esterase